MAPPSLTILPRALPKGEGGGKLGTGQTNGTNFNNAGFLALFAILGAALVIASIWFFFIAKRGGFKRISKDDWDDYKSTVLRRKGPDGKTLSNATKSTKLGGGSVVPKWAKTEYTRSTESSYDGDEMREVEEGRHGRSARDTRHTSRHDPELAAYKHEKVAKVGGINTSLHGSQWDYTNTDRSDVTPAPAVAISKKDAEKAAKKAEKDRKAREKAEQKEAARREKEMKKLLKTAHPSNKDVAESHPMRENQQTPPRRSQPSAAYSFHQGDDGDSTVYTATETQSRYTQPQSSVRQVSYYENYRPHSTQLPPVREQPTPPVSSYRSPSSRREEGTRSHHASRESMQHRRENSSSPRKQHRPVRSEYTASSAAESGTKVYEHHIPGLSKGEVGVEDSVSQVGARRHYQSRTQPSGGSGFRRGAGGRNRDDELDEVDF